MDFMDWGALIETGVISILFVFAAAPQACLWFTGTFMEMSALKGRKKIQEKCILFL